MGQLNHDNVLMDTDLPTRTIRVFHWDEDNQRAIVEDRQDVEPILENVKAVGSLSVNKKAFFRPAASIPLNIYHQLREQWNREGRGPDERKAALKRWLNDSDYGAIWKFDKSFKV